MSHAGKDFNRHSMIACVSIVIAVFTSAPILAQQKPIVIEPNAVVSNVAKALTVLNKPGSYVLSRDLVNARAGVDSVDINASNVTIDLQGFSIISSVSSTGVGINATGQSNVVIRNGIITGQGGPAIIVGPDATISGITASQNSLSSSVGASIEAGNGSQIIFDNVSEGGSGGVSCSAGCLARDNVIQGNLGVGMNFIDATDGYLGNVMQGNDGINSGSTGQVSGGTSLGQNLCNSTTC